MSEIAIEEIGGFTGAGGPGGPIQTRGQINATELTPGDRAALDKLFAENAPVNASLRYRISRKVGARTETVEAAPDRVPQVLIRSLRTTLE